VIICQTEYSPNNVLIDGLFGFPFFLNSAAPPKGVKISLFFLSVNHPLVQMYCLALLYASTCCI
jgi:hypothetical protein